MFSQINNHQIFVDNKHCSYHCISMFDFEKLSSTYLTSYSVINLSTTQCTLYMLKPLFIFIFWKGKLCKAV